VDADVVELGVADVELVTFELVGAVVVIVVVVLVEPHEASAGSATRASRRRSFTAMPRLATRRRSP
jgi:hypothetical protein